MAPKSKSKASKSNSASTSALSTQMAPQWPSLQPLDPVDLSSIEQPLPGQIVLIRNFFTPKLCKSFLSFLSSLPFTTTPGKPKKGEATRVNDRYQVDDQEFADRLWQSTGLLEAVQNHFDPHIWEGEVLGLNSNIRVYRYTPGQFFDKHYDESNALAFGKDKVKAKTTWTLLLYLTTCEEGGSTVFYPESMGKRKEAAPDPIEVAPEPGLLLLHKHGFDCLLHEGREVVKGEKWILRSDLVVKR